MNDPTWILSWLTLAAVLLLCATVLARRTDWRPPGGDDRAETIGTVGQIQDEDD